MPARTFKFRLQTVLEYKIRCEENEQRILAEKKEILAREEGKLHALKSLKDERQRELMEKSEKGILNIVELKMYHEQQKQLRKDIAAQEIRVQQASADVEIQRQKLLEATKEKKTYEKLKEKHHEEYLVEVAADEQKLLDEIATTKFDRENRHPF